MVRLEAERERLSQLVITRETAGELLARVAGGDPGKAVRDALLTAEDVSPFAGAERRVVGVLAVPKWQPGLEPEVLPRVHQDILEVVGAAAGPVRAKQIVPRIGLPAETAKVEGTRSKLKRLVEPSRLDEDTPGLFTPARNRTTGLQVTLKEGLFPPSSQVPTETNRKKEEPGWNSTTPAARLTRLPARSHWKNTSTTPDAPLIRQLLQDHLDLRAIREEQRARDVPLHAR